MADAADRRLRCRARLPHLALRPQPGARRAATSSFCASGSVSASSPSRSRSATTPPTRPRSSPSRSMRCSTSTTPCRCPSGRAAGCKEKARQGHLVGSLPWGYVRDPDTKIAVPDPERAPLVLAVVRALRHRPGVRPHARRLAERRRARAPRAAGTSARTPSARCSCNAAYAGYVSGLRDKTRAIEGCTRRSSPTSCSTACRRSARWRARVVKPGPPSDEYLLRKLLRCERCGARMHGTRGSRTAVRRYMCSTRRYGHSCGERIVKAEALESQLIDWIRAFQPDGQLHDLLLQTLNAQTAEHAEQPAARRNELLDQLQRLQDLYVLGDLTKAQYVMRRQALEEETTTPRPTRQTRHRPRRSAARRLPCLLGDRDPAHRAAEAARPLFEQIWAENGQIVAVQPHDDFRPTSKPPPKPPKGGLE